MKYTRIVAIGLLLSPMLGVAGANSAAATGRGGGWQVVRHHGIATGGLVEDLGVVCDAASQCLTLQKTSGVQFSGDSAGSGVQGGAYMTSPTGVLAVSTLGTFVGTEAHCGTGTVVYTIRGTADLTTSTILTYHVDFVAGTGTGDFVGLTGFEDGRADLADPDSPGTASGTLRCRRH